MVLARWAPSAHSSTVAPPNGWPQSFQTVPRTQPFVVGGMVMDGAATWPVRTVTVAVVGRLPARTASSVWLPLTTCVKVKMPPAVVVTTAPVSRVILVWLNGSVPDRTVPWMAPHWLT